MYWCEVEEYLTQPSVFDQQNDDCIYEATSLEEREMLIRRLDEIKSKIGGFRKRKAPHRTTRSSTTAPMKSLRIFYIRNMNA